MAFCPQCGANHPDEADFCGECGFSLQEAPIVQPDISDVTIEQPKKKKKIWLPICLSTFGLVLIGVAVWFFFLRGTSLKNYGLYWKDGDIFYTDCSPGNGWNTGIFSGIKDDPELINFADSSTISSASQTYAMSKDGKILFLTEREQDSALYSLYYLKTDNPDGRTVEIGEDIFAYAISDDGQSVFCLEGIPYSYSSITLHNDSELYYYDLKTGEKQTIAEDIIGFYASADGNHVGYTIYDDGETVFCLWEKDGTNKEIHTCDGFSSIYVNHDFSTFYGEVHNGSDTNLYTFDVASGNKEKIASDGYFAAIYESGAYYYYNRECKDHSENHFGELFYFDGKETTTVMDCISMQTASFSTPIMVGASSESTIYDTIIVENRVNEIDPIDGTVLIAPNGSAVYIIDQYSGEMFKYPISEKRVGKPQSMGNIHLRSFNIGSNVFFLADDSIVYCRYNKTRETVDLYVEDESIASDVYYNVNYAGEILMFLADYEEDSGTLQIYTDGQLTEVADDVYDYILTPEKDILYLKDYDFDDAEGTLYLYDIQSGKTEELEDGVSAIAYILPGSIRGNFYYLNRYYLDMQYTFSKATGMCYNYYEYTHYTRGFRWDLLWDAQF